MPVRSFKDQGTRDIAEEVHSVPARRKLPPTLFDAERRKLVFLDNAHSLQDLSNWRGLHLEKLKGDRKVQYSIRINERYRVCFRWLSVDAFDVEIVDYH